MKRDMIACFFFNDTATTEIYTLSLHDALPISIGLVRAAFGMSWPRTLYGAWLVLRANQVWAPPSPRNDPAKARELIDRKSTRLNSSHANISYAVFCLKKKTNHALISSSSHTVL